MSLLTDIQKNLRAHHVIFVIGLLVLAVALVQYGRGKGMMRSGMQNAVEHKEQAMYDDAAGFGGEASAASSADLAPGQLGDAAPVNGGSAARGLPSCASKPVLNASELLPSDSNNEWAKLNPRASGDFQNVNLLRAGYWHGIDTVGSSLRNANLQVRSEPPNPTNHVSPWNNTTISPDLMRVPLEIGQGCQ